MKCRMCSDSFRRVATERARAATGQTNRRLLGCDRRGGWSGVRRPNGKDREFRNTLRGIRSAPWQVPHPQRKLVFHLIRRQEEHHKGKGDCHNQQRGDTCKKSPEEAHYPIPIPRRTKLTTLRIGRPLADLTNDRRRAATTIHAAACSSSATSTVTINTPARGGEGSDFFLIAVEE